MVTWRADTDVMPLEVMVHDIGPLTVLVPVPRGLGEMACRCYRCGTLLTAETVSVDRIIPGCQGGTYRRDNIRPACERCNSITGGATRSTVKKEKVTMVQIKPNNNGRRVGQRGGTVVDAPRGKISRKDVPCRKCGAKAGFSCWNMISVRQVKQARDGAYLKAQVTLHPERGR